MIVVDFYQKLCKILASYITSSLKRYGCANMAASTYVDNTSVLHSKRRIIITCYAEQV